MWHIKTDTDLYRDSAQIYVYPKAIINTDLRIFAGTDINNATEVVEGNYTVSIGAPLRVPISSGVLVLSDLINSTEFAHVTLWYQVVGEPYKWFERPFMGKKVGLYYATLVALPICAFISILLVFSGICCVPFSMTGCCLFTGLSSLAGFIIALIVVLIVILIALLSFLLLIIIPIVVGIPVGVLIGFPTLIIAALFFVSASIITLTCCIYFSCVAHGLRQRPKQKPYRLPVVEKKKIAKFNVSDVSTPVCS